MYKLKNNTKNELKIFVYYLIEAKLLLFILKFTDYFIKSKYH